MIYLLADLSAPLLLPIAYLIQDLLYVPAYNLHRPAPYLPISTA